MRVRQRLRSLDPHALAAHRPGDGRVVEGGELGGDRTVALAVVDPAEAAVVEDHHDDRDALLDGRQQAVHGDPEAAVAADGHGCSGRMDQLGGQRGREGVAHPAHGGRLEVLQHALGAEVVHHEQAVLAGIAAHDGVVRQGQVQLADQPTAAEIGVSPEHESATSQDPSVSWASATRREPRPSSASPTSTAASQQLASTTRASPSTAWATGKVQPAWRGSTSIWTMACRSGSRSSWFSKAVSVGPSLVPTARIRSASRDHGVRRLQPERPEDAERERVGLGEDALARGGRDDRARRAARRGPAARRGRRRSGRRCRPRSVAVAAP